MSSCLYHIDADGSRTMVGRVGSGRLRVDTEEVTRDGRELLPLLADIARDPDAHFHDDNGGGEHDAETALALLDAYLGEIDWPLFLVDIAALRGRVRRAAK